MKIIFPLIIFLAFSCKNIDIESFTITDITKAYEYKIKPQKPTTWKIIVSIKGEIDGDGKIVLTSLTKENSSSIERLLTSGKVEKTIQSDWYQNAGKIEFIPEGCRKGYLKVEMKFIR